MGRIMRGHQTLCTNDKVQGSVTLGPVSANICDTNHSLPLKHTALTNSRKRFWFLSDLWPAQADLKVTYVGTLTCKTSSLCNVQPVALCHDGHTDLIAEKV